MTNIAGDTIKDAKDAGLDGANTGLNIASVAMGSPISKAITDVTGKISTIAGYADAANSAVDAYASYGWAGAVSAGAWGYAKELR